MTDDAAYGLAYALSGNSYLDRLESDYRDARKAVAQCVELFDAWKAGVFADLRIQWIEEPPAIQAAREWLIRRSPLPFEGGMTNLEVVRRNAGTTEDTRDANDPTDSSTEG